MKDLNEIITPKFSNGCIDICESCYCHVFHQYTIRVLSNKRDKLAQYFSDLKIPFGIYYPIPLHRQKAYNTKDYKDVDFPNTILLCDEVISLPMHSELDDDQINFICDKIKDFLN